MGHKYYQRHLSKNRRFAGHVGTGDNQYLIFGIIHLDGVWHKTFSGNHFFHHRMTPVLNQNIALGVKLRPVVVILVGNFSQVQQTIQTGQKMCHLLNGDIVLNHLVFYLIKQLVFKDGPLILGTQNFCFILFQFIGNITLCIHKRLFANIVQRNIFRSGLGNLYKVSEHLVIPYFKSADSRCILLFYLESGQPLFPIPAHGNKLIEFNIVAGFDDTAFIDCGWCIFTYGSTDQAGQFTQAVDILITFKEF